MLKKSFPIFLIPLFMVFFTVPSAFADKGIPLQMDVYLGTPILSPEDLPDQITFTLYDSKTAAVPLGSQTFTRGQYTVDFEFSKSDGVSSGNVARIKANFSQKLNLIDAQGEAIKPKEIWSGLEIAGTELGSRTKVSDETMVQLLLASDASLATYLTLVYQGDDNPLTTIYKTLPISSLSSDGSAMTLSSYFSAVAAGTSDGIIKPNSTGTPYWERVGGYLFYNDGNVGIGTTAPSKKFEVVGDIQSRSGAIYDYFDASSSLYGGTIYRGLDGTNKASFLVYGSSHPTNANHFYIKNYNADGSIRFSAGGGSSIPQLIISPSGKVGIGTTETGSHLLAVEGSIGCRELTVTAASWADFVFEENYQLTSLSEVEKFIQDKRHLPGIPTEAEVRENGISFGDISSKLLQKVEEVTLYLIELKKENKDLKKRIANLESQLKKNTN